MSKVYCNSPILDFCTSLSPISDPEAIQIAASTPPSSSLMPPPHPRPLQASTYDDGNVLLLHLSVPPAASAPPSASLISRPPAPFEPPSPAAMLAVGHRAVRDPFHEDWAHW